MPDVLALLYLLVGRFPRHAQATEVGRQVLYCTSAWLEKEPGLVDVQRMKSQKQRDAWREASKDKTKQN